MARPLVNSTIFANESGNQPASQLDTWFSNIRGVINDSASGWVNYATDTGTTNAYAVTLVPPPSGYAPGFTIVFNPQSSNTGASTLNVNALGSQSILNLAGNALQSGDIVSGSAVEVVYNGTAFVLVSPSSSALPLSASQFTVSPGPGLSVNISIVGTELITGTSFLAGSSTASNLALTAPVSNTYYATVYYDQTANTFGVTYSPSSASPVLSQAITPDAIWQIPLAVIQIASSATSVTSASILDLRQNQYGVLNVSNTYAGSAQTINCFGAKRVIWQNVVSVNINQTFTFSNLAEGVDLFFRYTNTSAGSNLVKFAAKIPSGTSYSSALAEFPGSATDMIATGASVPTTLTFFFSGKSSLLGGAPVLSFIGSFN